MPTPGEKLDRLTQVLEELRARRKLEVIEDEKKVSLIFRSTAFI